MKTQEKLIKEAPAFVKMMNDFYTILYNNPDEFSHERKICYLNRFDNILENHLYDDFMREVVRIRQDFISSDREAIAFVITLDIFTIST